MLKTDEEKNKVNITSKKKNGKKSSVDFSFAIELS